MISDESDEDADTLDDDDLLESYLAPDSPDRIAAERKSGRGSAAAVRDWPASPEPDAALHLDAETLAWFKANHADWRRGAAGVLRAWVVARTRAPPDIQPRG
jgi:hypothetical protein